MAKKVYGYSELEGLSDTELLATLQSSWGYEDDNFEVWGEVTLYKDRKWGHLKNPRMLTSNDLLSYPLTGVNGPCEFWINPADAKKYGDQRGTRFIKCKLNLSRPEEREKHRIPFMMSVLPGSCSSLEKLPASVPHDLVTADEVSYFIANEIYHFYQQQAATKIEQEFASKQSTLDQQLAEMLAEKQSAEVKRDNAIKLVESLDSIRKQTEESIALIETDNELKQKQFQISLENFKKIEDEMNHKILRLKKYISDKALFLKNFEFLDQEDLDNFLVESRSASKDVDGVAFRDQLNGDYNQAVSYLQAHLVEKDILYPRHIIENYLTLLRTKDLIILAGDSGSGKTNLVKSFAKAVGGKAVIIPVKPNWTSSEDLLGYYNPLEKKYLATPFLDALLEAQLNPETPYFICLDEMNLARVEYYFADFLSLLESRDEVPEINLYSADESAHVLSELKAVVEIIQASKEKYNQDGVVNFISLLKDEAINNQLRQAFGFSDKNSLIKYHSEVRRMLSAAMSMPSSIVMPANVHIIGAINIDETTHYLSPKILDRAHIMRFESPLLSDWDAILREVDEHEFDDVSRPLLFETEALGIRQNYPKFDRENEFCQLFIVLNKEFLHKLGVEFGMRTIRQGLNYLHLFKEVNDDGERAINNFILHKILPKLTFDGNKTVGQQTKLELIEKVFLHRIKQEVPTYADIPDVFSAVVALENVVNDAKSNDGIVNFWS